jgi:hypothetical protein
MEKLSIIVPYRDRESHLSQFIPHMEKSEFLSDIDFEILIVEQTHKAFNRGKLLNVGVMESQEASYYCFHDVDMLPEKCDYSPCQFPTHLASEAQQFGYKLPYEGYFGGVTLFNKSSFFKINGFSNNYWGWGAEDDDVRFRCVSYEVVTQRRSGIFTSLNHERVIERDLYLKNLGALGHLTNSPDLESARSKILMDGLTTLEYEKVEDKWISDKTRKILVNI